jgi:hypothetical protein
MYRNKSTTNQAPRIITARFPSKCSESGQPIQKGEHCLYYPSDKTVYRLNTKHHQDFLSWSFDVNVLGSNY